MNLVVIISLLFWPLSALALNADHAGTYAAIHTDGHVTDMVFKTAYTEDGWKFASRNGNSPWEKISCEGDCANISSTQEDIKSFVPPSTLNGFYFDCVHNRAFAFCFYTEKQKPSSNGYLFIALVTGKPMPIHLKRLPN